MEPHCVLNTTTSSSSSMEEISKKKSKSLPVDTTFKLPSPFTCPRGGGFATGTINLGGLKVCQISTFTKIWMLREGGPDNAGATFFEPSPIPKGFYMLGCHAQPNNTPLFGYVLVAAEDSTTTDPNGPLLKQPIDYTLVLSSDSLKIKQDGVGFIWVPIPPDGYKAVGYVITTSSNKPPLDKIRCVRSDYTDTDEVDELIWGLQGTDGNTNGSRVYASRPTNRGVQALGVATGTFIVQDSGSATTAVACLKNVKGEFSAMPNLAQVQALVNSYSPVIYFHPDDEYLPASVSWFFENGALLYKKGDEKNPVRVDPTGSNLPQGGSNDGEYWLDLPIDEAAKKKVKKGDLQTAGAYLHVKPMLGATFTDIAIWVFYPFNGPSRAKVKYFNVGLGKIGEHIGDWEHITLRISNFSGELRSVYFSQHSKGQWVNSPGLEFQGTSSNKPVVYSSLHGHAFYPKPGLVLQGNDGIGIRNDTAKGKAVIDVGKSFQVIWADHVGGSAGVEPPWLNFARNWGPKIEYDSAEEIKKVVKVVPEPLKSLFRSIIGSLPNELFGEEGPSGPKWKDNWSGDERA